MKLENTLNLYVFAVYSRACHDIDIILDSTCIASVHDERYDFYISSYRVWPDVCTDYNIFEKAFEKAQEIN